MRFFARRIKVKKRDIPAGVWTKCRRCKEMVTSQEVEENLMTCPKCGYLSPLPAPARIRSLFADGEFHEIDARMRPADPLKFVDSLPYPKRQQSAEKRSGLPEAVVTGIGSLGGFAVACAVMDFEYMGGSMGSVVGEKITRLIEAAIEKRIPLLIISSSGGARMQEGALSLLQLAKTSAALARLDAEGILFVSVMTNPTTGGTTASFASLGDVIVAEPGALIGFAGPRVIKQTIQQDLPDGFQTAEFLLAHGMVDMIVPRRELGGRLAAILSLFGAPRFRSAAHAPRQRRPRREGAEA
ncbi:MAG: acetyl-CoA carboxylase, carboxyltransferase subunit beta [bacterium]|nr:acetyl-CoA carboxylase, carboxyltransferase subunit beta [bacterium]